MGGSTVGRVAGDTGPKYWPDPKIFET